MLTIARESRRLPAFVVIGAAKAATTWIARQLRERPDVFMPGPEPHFFSREYDRGLDWYADLFGPAQDMQLIGEKSADYLADPNVPSRMSDLLPNARIIVQLRNPVDRAYSDYCMLFRQARAGKDIDRELHPTSRFLADGLYARHLARFLEYYPREQVMVLFFEDIILKPEQILRDVCHFLGLPARAPVADVAERVNDGQAALLPWALRRLPRSMKNLARPLRGTMPFEAVRSLVARPVRYPDLSGVTRRRLQDFYRDDVQALGTMLGRDLSFWCESQEEAV